MKKILITGAGSYIGTSFEKWITKYDGYLVDTVDTMNDSWRKVNFSQYDAVFHVAGLAHSNPKPEMKDLYYKVNTDFAFEVAKFAKDNKVKQFIFMSSIILFGNKNECITENSIPKPENFYGDSKLQADIKLQALNDDAFKVVSIRPPMIYGKNSKGNYPRLSKLAKKIRIFPGYENKRSMLHIDNLCEFVKMIIDNEERGIFYPQNKEYVSTRELVCEIGKLSGNKIIFVNWFNPLIKILSRKIVVFNKLFGNLVYEKSMSDYNDFSYCVNDFKESIKRTER